MKQINPILLSLLISFGSACPEANTTIDDIKETVQTCLQDPKWSDLFEKFSETSNHLVELFNKEIKPQLSLGTLEQKVKQVFYQILKAKELIYIAKLRASHPDLIQKIVRALCETAADFVSFLEAQAQEHGSFDFVVHIEGRARSLDEVKDIVIEHIEKFKDVATNYTSQTTETAQTSWLSKLLKSQPLPVQAKDVDQLLNKLSCELLKLFDLFEKNINSSARYSNTINEINNVTQGISHKIHRYKAELLAILKKNLENNLSMEEIGAVVQLVESDAYKKIIEQGPSIAMTLLGIVRDETQSKFRKILETVYSLSGKTLDLFNQALSKMTNK